MPKDHDQSKHAWVTIFVLAFDADGNPVDDAEKVTSTTTEPLGGMKLVNVVNYDAIVKVRIDELIDDAMKEVKDMSQ